MITMNKILWLRKYKIIVRMDQVLRKGNQSNSFKKPFKIDNRR